MDDEREQSWRREHGDQGTLPELQALAMQVLQELQP